MKPSDQEEDLFAQCLELPSEARGTFLDSVCPNDPELKRGVLELLESHESHGGFLDSLEQDLRARDEGSPGSEIGDTAGGKGVRPKGMSLFRYRVRKLARAYRSLGIGLVILGVLAYVFAAYDFNGQEGARASADADTVLLAQLDPLRIAILPIGGQGGDAGSQDLGEMLGSELRQRMEELDAVELVPVGATIALAESGASIATMAKELRSGSLLQGDAQIMGDRARMRIQLISAADGRTLMSEAYTRFAGDEELIAKGVAFEVANAVVDVVAPGALKLEGPLSYSDEALDAYQRGNELLGTGSLTKIDESIKEFEEALKQDSNFALAYIGLGFAHGRRGQLTPEVISEEERIESMRKAAERAQVIDANLPGAHVLLGLAQKLAGNRSLALRAFEEALRLDPNCAEAYMEMAQLEFEKRVPPMDPSYPQHMDTVLETIQMAIDCDPAEARYPYEMGYKLGYLGRSEESKAYFVRSVELNRNYSRGYGGLATAAIYHHGRFNEAILHSRSAHALDPLNLTYSLDIANCYEELGDNLTAAKWKQWIIDRREDMELLYQGDVYRLRGEDERAFRFYRSVFEGDWMHPALGPIRRRLLSRDLREGAIETARARYFTFKEYMTQGFALFEEEPVVRSHPEAIFAMEIAPIRMALGETEAAERLIDGSWNFFRGIPEADPTRAFHEMVMYALKGKNAKSIEVLRAAVDRGFRSRLNLGDARLDSLRSEPGFIEIQKIVDTDMERQLANIRRMEASGELAPLPEISRDLQRGSNGG